MFIPLVAALTLNTTVVKSGDVVHVDWTTAFATARPGVNISAIPPMRTMWKPKLGREGADPDAHVEAECIVVPHTTTASYWVGQFSPAVTDAKDVRMIPFNNHNTEGTPPWTVPAPVKFISGTQLTKGSYNFKVTNMRDNLNWVLFEGSLTSATGFAVVAMSPPITFTDIDEPMHGRLARTSSTDEMRVSWTSSLSAAHAQTNPSVQWGTSATALSYHTPTEGAGGPAQVAYTNNSLCGAPASTFGFHDPGVIFTAVLDLKLVEATVEERAAGQRIYYRFGGSSPAKWSSIRSFIAPKPRSHNTPMSIIVTADMGETYEDGSQYHWEEPAAVNTTTHMARIGGGNIDVILHPGDLAYATGYESEWDRFMEAIEELASQAPYMTGQGNHERDYPGSGNSIGAGDSGGECGTPTQARFHMPTCVEPNTAPCVGATNRSGEPALRLNKLPLKGPVPTSPADDGWYSFDQGSAHFLMMNTEKSSAVGSRQHTFMDADLAAVDRTVTPWVFVFGHRQMYSGNSMTPQNAMGDVEELLMTHKVDIAFWGHIHFAQASCAMFKAKCVTTKDAAGYDAPIHAVIGHAGQSLTKIPKPKAAWSIWNDAHWGFSHLVIANATHLDLNYYRDAPLTTPLAPLAHTFAINRAYPRV